MENPLHGLVDDLRQYLAGHRCPNTWPSWPTTSPARPPFRPHSGWKTRFLPILFSAMTCPFGYLRSTPGRNFQETYSTWNKTLLRYEKPIEVFAPAGPPRSAGAAQGPQQLLREHREPQGVLRHPQGGAAGAGPGRPAGVADGHPGRAVGQPPAHAPGGVGRRPPAHQGAPAL